MLLRVIVLAIALTPALALPSASAHIDLCFEGACGYEWDWSGGEGSCRDTTSWWWSHRVASASVFGPDGTRHTVEAELSCYAFEDGAAGSSVHVGYVTRGADGEWTWVYLDWYGSETDSSTSCTIRYWGHEQETLPEGTISEPCPARPPLLRA